ncbi:uncharacterized protein LOC111695377 [Eurytemora carolleeae]|uniref:uncharacterized protein LOC111695377 n=1 Tax=Eurytemora carolleeae TaxID=1294199 RepID=UPI000C7762EF|nr:uncharacterized protein LOC111695377 [Eurytemora carolleeae]|eukprot:XP_023320464.1 uncharacterized protein LOC111695377 [Eurytemora affinis]
MEDDISMEKRMHVSALWRLVKSLQRKNDDQEPAMVDPVIRELMNCMKNKPKNVSNLNVSKRIYLPAFLKELEVLKRRAELKQQMQELAHVFRPYDYSSSQSDSEYEDYFRYMRFKIFRTYL